jgi:hypothetical protein
MAVFEVQMMAAFGFLYCVIYWVYSIVSYTASASTGIKFSDPEVGGSMFI